MTCMEKFLTDSECSIILYFIVDFVIFICYFIFIFKFYLYLLLLLFLQPTVFSCQPHLLIFYVPVKDQLKCYLLWNFPHMLLNNTSVF